MLDSWNNLLVGASGWTYSVLEFSVGCESFRLVEDDWIPTYISRLDDKWHGLPNMAVRSTATDHDPPEGSCPLALLAMDGTYADRRQMASP